MDTRTHARNAFYNLPPGWREIINLSNSEYCRICNSNTETLVHLFVSCKHVKKLWNDLKHWLNDVTGINLNFAAKDIILGYLLKTDLILPINVIILTTKSYIFSCAFMKRSLNLAHLKIKIKSVYEYEYFI